METFGVRITKDDLVFSAAHFITLDAKQCERLHGHNYRVTATVEGALNEYRYFVDFVLLHRLLREIIEPLDHRVLVPTEHPMLRIFESDKQVEIMWNQRRWVFPRFDCALVPMSNTTAEMLARHVGLKLLEALRTDAKTEPRVIRIELDEADNQSAFYEWRADA